jgi:hypothetical protein
MGEGWPRTPDHQGDRPTLGPGQAHGEGLRTTACQLPQAEFRERRRQLLLSPDPGLGCVLLGTSSGAGRRAERGTAPAAVEQGGWL